MTDRPPDPLRDRLEAILEDLLAIEMAEDLEQGSTQRPAPRTQPEPGSSYWCCGNCHPWHCPDCGEYHCSWFDETCPVKTHGKPADLSTQPR